MCMGLKLDKRGNNMRKKIEQIIIYRDEQGKIIKNKSKE